jgi:hypothetical protein
MTRRTIGLLVTLAFLFVPLAAETQPATHVYRIGRLSSGYPPAGPDPNLEAFDERGHTPPRNPMECGMF